MAENQQTQFSGFRKLVHAAISCINQGLSRCTSALLRTANDREALLLINIALEIAVITLDVVILVDRHAVPLFGA